jgi:glucose dehydrogenase
LPMPYAYGAETTLTLSGTVFNAFLRVIKPLEKAGTVSVKYGARAVRLEWSPRERRVKAVIFRDTESGVEGRVPCRAVIVAAGAINTPEVLLRSTSSDFPNGLGNTHGVLGRYLHDHPLGKLVVDLERPLAIHPASYVTRPVLEHSPALYAAAGMQWSGAAIYGESVMKRSPGRLPWIGFSVFGTMEPSVDNWIALDSRASADGSGSGLELHVRHEPKAIETLDATRDQVVEMLARAGLSPRVRIWKIEAVGNSNHYGGSCRMHASPQFGMVDAWSRLHGVSNVSVADSSVFTTGPEKNPVLTSMTLAARAADRLAADIRAGDL